MDYAELLNERARLNREARGITDKAIAEGRSLTSEEQDRDDEISARLGTINELVAKVERDRERERATLRNAGVNFDEPEPQESAAAGGFASFGEFLQAVYNSSQPGGHADPRLFATITGSGSAIPSDGGFLVRTEWSSMLLNKVDEAAVLAPLCDTFEPGPGFDGVELPYVNETSRATGSRYGGVQVYRAGEADTVTATKPTFAMMDLRLEDMMGLWYATNRILRDAALTEQIAVKAFQGEFAWKLDNEILRGNGVGQCEGILSAAALITVTKETGQAADTVVNKNISKMWNRLHARSRATAQWFINQDVEPQLDELYIPAGTGALEPRFVTYGPDGVMRIKGRPVTAIEQASTLGDAGDINLLDLREYLLIRKGALEQAESIHVRFLNNEKVFRFVMSVNGAPKWRTTLAAANGSATYSPFVTLAARA